MLPNIGDTDRRCSQMKKPEEWGGPDDAMTLCDDASDNVQRAPLLMAPLRTVPIPDLSSAAKGTISVSDERARGSVRIFRPKGEDWEIVEDETTFSAEELAKGLQLGIDSRDTRGFKNTNGEGIIEPRDTEHPLWDGKATVRFTVTDGDKTSTDSVMLRVAPILTPHHLQRVEKVLASKISGGDRGVEVRKAMLEGIGQSMKKAGLEGGVSELATYDKWAQDIFEAAYASMPGPEGPISLRIMVPSHGREQSDAVYTAFQVLRETGVGAVYHPGLGNGGGNTLDAMGNLETIPPYEFNGKRYPAGRIIMGGNVESNRVPHLTEFLRAQEVQDPIILDSTWLHVQHVDEYVQFMPAKSPRGWCVMVSDPLGALQILKDADANGLGETPLSSHFIPPQNRGPNYPFKISNFFENPEWRLRVNNETAQRIEKTIDILKKETGVTDEEIIRVPVLYSSKNPAPKQRRDEEWRQAEDDQSEAKELDQAEAAGGRVGGNERRDDAGVFPVSSTFPSAINGLVLSDSVYVAPKQFGPVVNGTDIMEEAVKKAYGKIGYTVDFVDDFPFFRAAGDVHCATNTLRDTSIPWWKI